MLSYLFNKFIIEGINFSFIISFMSMVSEVILILLWITSKRDKKIPNSNFIYWYSLKTVIAQR